MPASPPTDINPDTGSRLPLPDRDALEEWGQAQYDRYANFQDGAIMGLKGPSALSLHSPDVMKHAGPLNGYLRFHTDLGAELRELAILIAAREMDSHFEWAAHEDEAQKEGVPAKVVDVVKHRKSTDGLSDDHKLVIDYGRAVLRDHAVPPELFAKLRERFGPKGVVDLAYLMGNYVTLAIFLATVNAQIPDGAPSTLPVD